MTSSDYAYRVREYAYHEAAHAVAFVRHDIRFRFVHLCGDDGVIRLSSGAAKDDANGTVEVEDPAWHFAFIYRHDDEIHIPVLAMLAGLVVSKRFRPRATYAQLIEDGTASRDWNSAVTYVQLLRRWRAGMTISADIASIEVWLLHRRTRQFVQKEWPAISVVAESLMNSPLRRLSFDKVCRLLHSRSAHRRFAAQSELAVAAEE